MSEIVPQVTPQFTAFRQNVERLLLHLPSGAPYWSARDLQEFFEYAAWQKFEAVIAKASESVLNAGLTPEDHFNPTVKKVRIGSGTQRDVLDYQVSRLGCYHLAMMADAEKPQAAFGRLYFSAQTYAAEVAQDKALADAEDPVLAQLAALTQVRREQIALGRQVAQQGQEIAQVRRELADAPIQGGQIDAIHKLGQQLGRLMGGTPTDRANAWRLFKSRFSLASYRDLPRSQFDEAVRFLRLQIDAYTGSPSPLLGGEA